MLTLVTKKRSSSCDRATRRDFMRVGSLGMAGMTLPNLLRAKAEAEMQPTTAPEPDLPDTEPATPATFEDKMQTIMFSFTTLVDRMGREEFLKTCGLSAADYEEIKQAWRDNLGVEV